MYNKAGTALLACPNGKSPVAIPDGITTIGDYAFFDYDSTIIIPDSVTTIGASAFGSSYIASITIAANVNIGPNIAWNWGSFIQFYNSNGKKAGTHTYAASKWTREED